MKAVPIFLKPTAKRSLVLFSFVLCSGLLALFAGQATAQTSLPGYTPPAVKPKPELSHDEKARRGTAPLSRISPQIKLESVRVHRLPALNAAEMRPEQKSGRLRIGAIRSLDRSLDIQSDGAVLRLPEGRLYLLRVASEAAAMMRLHFNRVALPSGARLFVYSRSNPDDYHALHVPEDNGLDATGQSEFWTPPLTGEEVVIEYLSPANARGEQAAQQPPPFVIDRISHVFIDPRSTGQNGAAACNANVPAEWGEAAKSVGLLQFATPKGEFACSGVLLNTSRNDNQPFFLTANHCLSDSRFVQSVTVHWLYISGNSPGSGTPVTNGGSVIATGIAGDFSLMQLNQIPPGVRRAGWSAEPATAATPVTSVHHPQASYQRFAAGQTIADNCPNDVPGGCEHFLPVRWQQGITEPGSSGAPLFAGTPNDPRVVGVLSGGLSACDNRQGVDYYGRFEKAFPVLAPYLIEQGCAFVLQGTAQQGAVGHDAKTQEIFSAAGGDGKIRLFGKGFSGCAWTARAEADWITLTSPAEGTGNAIITYSVAPHTSSNARHGYLLIAGHRLLVSQMGVSNCAGTGTDIGQVANGALAQSDCRSALEPQSYIDRFTFNAVAGQQFSMNVMSSDFDTFLLLYGPDGKVIDFNDDAYYSSNSFLPPEIRFIEAAMDGVYTIEVTSYDPGATGAYRLTINRHCFPRLTPDPLPLIPPTGGPGTLNVVSPFGCPWTAQSNASWLTITAGQGNGNGAISFIAMPYEAPPNSSPREAQVTINISGNSFPYVIKQQPICSYSISSKSLSVRPVEAIYDSPLTQALAVNTGSSCQWMATSNMPGMEFWQLGSSYTTTGGQYINPLPTRVRFGDTPITGTLTIAGQTVAVTIKPLGTLCPISTLGIGQTITDSLAPNCRSVQENIGYVKQYKFQGRAGQRIALVFSSLEFSPRVWLRQMDGDNGLITKRLVPQVNFEGRGANSLRMPERDYITLPADGMYFLEVVNEIYPDRGGNFVLSLLEAANASCSFTTSVERHNLIAGGERGNLGITATNSNCAWTATATAPWIKLMTTSGNGSGLLEYSVEPNAGAFRTGVIAVAGRHLAITQQPANAPAIVSAADYAPNMAINGIHAMFGVGLATQTVVAATQPLPTSLGGTRITVTDGAGSSYDAPLFFVSPGQINFLMPRNLSPGVANLTVKVNDQTVGVAQAAINYFAPSLFTADGSGRGMPAAYLLRVRRDGTRTEESIFDRDGTGRITPRAIRLADDEEVYLILYGTGFNGQPFSGTEVEAAFQPDLKQKAFMFAAPGFAGLDQINLLLPLSLRGRGDVTLTVKHYGFASNPVTIRISGQ